MKNIHILPTDKPSRLYLTTKEYILDKEHTLSTDECENKNIYITSDGEIKEGDSVILKSGRLTKAEVQQGTLGFHTVDGITFLYFQNDDKKIILTTDADLINKGVQSIDDEFLQWFVKNPNCEEIGIIKCKHPLDTGKVYNEQLTTQTIKCDKCGTISIFPFGGDYYCQHYKIIIPKEEPKQEYCDNCNNTVCCCIFKTQETIEEAAKSDATKKYGIGYHPDIEKAFIRGTNWQAETYQQFTLAMDDLKSARDGYLKGKEEYRLKEEALIHNGNVLTTEEIMAGRSSKYEFIDFNKSIQNAEEETLEKIKFVLLSNNDAQAIRIIEQYGYFKEEKMYNESDIRNAIDFGAELGLNDDIGNSFEWKKKQNKWFDEFKKK